MKKFKVSIILLAMCMSIILCGFGINKNKEPKEIHIFEGIIRKVISDSYYRMPRYIVQSDDGVRALFIGDHDFNIPPEASNQLLAIEGDRVIIKYYNPDEIIGFEILEMA